jgi:Holliday junction resolvase RusA-like endonuclease
MTEEEHEMLLQNIERGKKKVSQPIPEQDLFGSKVEIDILSKYKEIFKTLIAEKNYIFIRTNVQSKKNQYIAYSRWTGRSVCCDAAYDKNTRICTSCGKTTKSGKAVGSIGLNAKALKYKKDSLQGYINARAKIQKELENKTFALIGVFLIRDSARRFDFDNVTSMICDQLTDAKIISDDAARNLIILPLGYVIDKNNPGLILKVLNEYDYFQFLLNQIK